MDVVTLALSKKYTKDTVIGLGALKGANCTISSIVPILDAQGKEIANEVTFKWTATDGTIKTDTITVKNGDDATGTVYDFPQATPSTTWTIQHNLNADWYTLGITCLDDDDNIIIGDIDTTSSTVNLLVIQFKDAVAGKVLIKK